MRLHHQFPLDRLHPTVAPLFEATHNNPTTKSPRACTVEALVSNQIQWQLCNRESVCGDNETRDGNVGREAASVAHRQDKALILTAPDSKAGAGTAVPNQSYICG